jgi:hypothetical protein
MGDLLRKYHSRRAFLRYKQEAQSITVFSNQYKAKKVVATPASQDGVSQKKLNDL